MIPSLFCPHYTDLAGRYGCPSYTCHKKKEHGILILNVKGGVTARAPPPHFPPSHPGHTPPRPESLFGGGVWKAGGFSPPCFFFVSFGHCIIGHILSPPYIKKQDPPHGLPCKSKGRASEDALPVVHNNPPNHDPAAWPSTPLPRPGRGVPVIAQNRPGFLLRKPGALRFYGKRLRRCKASVQQRADPCPGGRLGLELIVHLQGWCCTPSGSWHCWRWWRQPAWTQACRRRQRRPSYRRSRP